MVYKYFPENNLDNAFGVICILRECKDITVDVVGLPMVVKHKKIDSIP